MSLFSKTYLYLHLILAFLLHLLFAEVESCYDLRCKGKVIGGFGVDLWRIRVASYSTHGATVATSTVNTEKVERGS
jgi:hypothetical protein